MWQGGLIIQNQLTGKGVIVTGTTKGIGKALAKEFRKRGARVYEVNRKEYDVRFYRKLLNLEEDLKDFGSVDILVNSAALKMEKSFKETTIEEFEDMMQTNFFGYFYMIKVVLPMMKMGSQIINIGSIKGLHSKADSSPYCASKFAVTGLTGCLREELRADGIKVSLVCPSATDQDVGSYEGRTITTEHVVDMVFTAIDSDHYIIFPNLEKLIIHKLRGLF